MGTTLENIEDFLKDYQYNDDIPLTSLLSQISNIYHKCESSIYDKNQKGIFSMEETFGKILYDLFITEHLPDKITALDFGCGTGFAALLLLNSSIGKKISTLYCFDLSPDMLAICKNKIDKQFPDVNVKYLSGEEGVAELLKTNIHVMITNAVLHHLPDLQNFFSLVDKILAQNGIYIAGHEPNERFYNNEELVLQTQQFSRFKKIKRRLNPAAYLQKLRLIKRTVSLSQEVNRILLEKRIIKKTLSDEQLRKLVDIHVPYGVKKNQLWGEMGFTAEKIAKKYGVNFAVLKEFSYTYIKDNEAMNNFFWKRKMKKLGEKYPYDGADVLMILKKF